MKKLMLVAAVVLAALAVTAISASANYVELGSFAGDGTGPGGNGSADGQMLSPGAVDVRTSTGRLYVADTGNDRVQVFIATASGGTYESQISMTDPTGLAVDQSTGSVYVSNAFGVSKFDDSLQPATGWTAPTDTGALAVDPSTHDLLLADQAAGLIRRYSPDGTPGVTFAADRPLDLAVDSNGDVIVVTSTGDIISDCSATSAVERFSATGVSDGTIGALGTPGAVAVDPDDDQVVVAAQVNQYNCGSQTPIVALFNADGSPGPTIALGDALFAAVPGLTAVGGGSSRIYAVTKSPLNDAFGATAVHVLEDVTPPSLTDPTTADVEGHQVEASATVNPNGHHTNWKFELSSDDGATWTASPGGAAGDGVSIVPITERLTGLQPATSYRVRAVAENPVQAVSAEATFTTPAAAPEVQTGAPGYVSADSARLDGTVDPNTRPTAYWIEYGTTSSLGSRYPLSQDGDAGDGRDPNAVHLQLTGLQPDTPYQYRLVARNDLGTTEGTVRSFRTQALATPPSTRAYEQVSPVDKNDLNVPVANGSNDSLVPQQAIFASPDGSAAVFGSNNPFSDTTGGGSASTYRARRGPTNWSSAYLNGPVSPSSFLAYNAVGGFSTDLSRFTVVGKIPESADTGGRPGYTSVMQGDGEAPFHRVAEALTAYAPLLASADGRIVTITSPDALTNDGQSAGALQVYAADDSGVRLVGIMPNGTVASDSAVASTVQNRHAVSADGTRILFTTSSQPGLYLRQFGSPTRRVSAPEDGINEPGGPSPATFRAATPDGKHVFFTSPARLTVDATATTGEDLYRYDVDSGDLTDLTVASPGEEANAQVFIATDRTGETSAFIALGQLDGSSGVANSPNLYVRRGNTTTFVATLAADDRVANPYGSLIDAALNEDGSHLAFASKADVLGFQSGVEVTYSQVYLYDLRAGTLVCGSCRKDGSAPRGSSVIAPLGDYNGQDAPRNVSNDGHLFFNSDDALAPQDTNDATDVYEYVAGATRLVSAGSGSRASYFADASSDGRDVFFTTRDQLVGQDQDENTDVYDARVGGGLSGQGGPRPEAKCTGDGCQDAPSLAPILPVAASVTFVGAAGEPDRRPSASPARSKVTASTKKGTQRGASFALSIKVPAKGRITVSGSGLKTSKKTAPKAGTYKLVISLTTRARSALKKKHKLAIKARVRYQPSAGKSSTAAVSVALKA